MELTLDKFGRILIPKKLRKLLGLGPGSRLRVVATRNRITLHPPDSEPVLEEENGVLVFTGELDGDPEQILRAVRGERIRGLGGE